MQKPFWLRIEFSRWTDIPDCQWQRSVTSHETYEDASKYKTIIYPSLQWSSATIQGPIYVSIPEPDPVKSNRRARPSRKDGTVRRQRGRLGEPD